MSEDSILDFRVRAIESSIAEIRDSQKSIAESLAKLVVLEQQHQATAQALQRAFSEIHHERDRIDELDTLPASVSHLTETLSEIKRFVYATVGVVLLAVFGLVFDAAINWQHQRDGTQEQQRAPA